jgi:two-component system, response regulator YesN
MFIIQGDLMYKLLVVDDEAIIRQGILSSINWDKLNIKTAEADNGLAAYDMISKDKYDIVLLDIKMPGLTGLELIKKVQNTIIDADITFVILSGYAEFNLANQAMRFGVKYYLLKPTDEDDIYSTLEKVIAERKLKNISLDKIDLLFNKISTHIYDYNIKSAKQEVKALFTMLEDYNNKQASANYCLELLMLIIRQCEDHQEMLKYLKISTEVDKNTSLDEIHKIIFHTIEEIVEINKKIDLNKYSKNIKLALAYINDNISNEKLTLALLSKQLYLNPNYLGKLFKKELKENFNDYISKIRIKKAQELIKDESNYKICEIAERVGFGCNSQYFSQVFKKYTSYTPSEYKIILLEKRKF